MEAWEVFIFRRQMHHHQLDDKLREPWVPRNDRADLKRRGRPGKQSGRHGVRVWSGFDFGDTPQCIANLICREVIPHELMYTRERVITQ